MYSVLHAIDRSRAYLDVSFGSRHWLAISTCKLIEINQFAAEMPLLVCYRQSVRELALSAVRNRRFMLLVKTPDR